MTRYTLLAEAEQDIEEISQYIANDSIEAAQRCIDTFFDAFETLAKMPRIGHTRRDLTPKRVLFWTVGTYLVVYRTRANTIEVVAVVHGARNTPEFLRERKL